MWIFRWQQPSKFVKSATGLNSDYSNKSYLLPHLPIALLLALCWLQFQWYLLTTIYKRGNCPSPLRCVSSICQDLGFWFSVLLWPKASCRQTELNSNQPAHWGNFGVQTQVFIWIFMAASLPAETKTLLGKTAPWCPHFARWLWSHSRAQPGPPHVKWENLSWSRGH